MRVALSAEVDRTHEELVERILHAGLAYSRRRRPADLAGDLQRAGPDRARATRAGELGVPLVSDAEFMALLQHVVGGTGIEEFTDATLSGDQFALF